MQFMIVELRHTYQQISRNHIAVHLMLQELPNPLLETHGLSSPFGIRMIQHRRLPSSGPSVKQMTHTVHIPHQLFEKWILWVISPRVKMRRTVLVRKRRLKCMRDKLINSTDEHVICQPLHQRDALSPSIGTEYLTHSPPCLFGIQAGA